MRILRVLIVFAVLLSFSIPVAITYSALNHTGAYRIILLSVSFISSICPFLLGIAVKEDWVKKEMEERRLRLIESKKWLRKMEVKMKIIIFAACIICIGCSSDVQVTGQNVSTDKSVSITYQFSQEEIRKITYPEQAVYLSYWDLYNSMNTQIIYLERHLQKEYDYGYSWNADKKMKYMDKIREIRKEQLELVKQIHKHYPPELRRNLKNLSEKYQR